MKKSVRRIATLASFSLGVIGAGVAVKSFLPRRFPTWYEPDMPKVQKSQTSLPAIDYVVALWACCGT